MEIISEKANIAKFKAIDNFDERTNNFLNRKNQGLKDKNSIENNNQEEEENKFQQTDKKTTFKLDLDFKDDRKHEDDFLEKTKRINSPLKYDSEKINEKKVYFES